MAILDGIKTSSDVKALPVKSLKDLSAELRERIISVANANGGHLSANLGVVEATVALHHVFDFPNDKLIFDVGHQCYANKMLSGRNDKFDTLRTDGGLSGFPCRDESEYDLFTTGHSGASLAQGLGVCSARDALKEDYFVINVVGDGSFVNGLNLEALFSSNNKPKKFIVILNDNGMSISRNKNGFYRYISRHTLGKSYRTSKKAVKKVFRNSFVTRFLRKIRNGIKRLFNQNNYLENFGFKYVGLVDGNDVTKLVDVLKDVKETAKSQAVLLHIKTTKGLGLEEAEENADLYHGVGKKLLTKKAVFSSALGMSVNELIENDGRVVAITAGMKDGTGLSVVENAHPDNFYDVGIAEEYAVTYAAGLAAGGLKPIVAIYSTFLQRAYDQIMHDVCLQNLPVIFCVDRAGLVGADGATHQGVFDLSYLTHLPNMTVISPTTPEELKASLKYALSLNSPVAIRYPNGAEMIKRKVQPFKKGLWETLREGDDVTLLAVGPRMVKLALDFASVSEKSVGVVSARVVKPLDETALEKIKNTTVITLEENAVTGGFGSAVMQRYALKGVKIKCLGVKDEFISHGSVETQLKENGLTVEGIKKAIESI